MYIKLTKKLTKQYDKYKISRDLAIDDNELHHQFNIRLRNFLVSCQEKEFFPSDEFIEKKCIEIKQNITLELSYKNRDNKIINPENIDFSIKSMQFLPIVTNQNVKNNITTMHLRVIGLIPIDNLSNKEIELIEKCFEYCGETEKENMVFKITLLNVPVSSRISENKQEQINQYLVRTARDTFKTFLKKHNLSIAFKYHLKDRIKDFWLDGGI